VSPETAFLLVYGSFGAAAIVALVADAAGTRRAVPVSAFLIFAGGAVSLYTAWTSQTQLAWGSFVVGAGFSAITGIVGVVCGVVLLAPDAESEGAAASQSSLLTLCAIGAGLAAQSTDVVTLIIALEIAAAAGYALVASARTKPSAEASMKYLIQGAMVTGILVLGVAIAVGAFESTGSYGALASATAGQDGRPLAIAVLLIASALVFKAGGAPFHSWAPDAYQTAPTNVAAFLAGPVKLAMVGALATFVSLVTTSGAHSGRPLGSMGDVLLPMIGGLAMVSIVIGSLVALRQSSYTRMLAYAGVAQVGYALMAIAAQSPGVAAFFTSTYAIATTGAFLAARSFAAESPDWDGSVAELAGIGRRSPILGISVSVLMLSLAGIPPLLGFWGKLQALQSAVTMALNLNASSAALGLTLWYVAITAVGIAGAVVSLAYYGSVLRVLYAPTPQAQRDATKGRTPVLIVGAIALVVFIAGLLPLLVPFGALVAGFRL